MMSGLKHNEAAAICDKVVFSNVINFCRQMIIDCFFFCDFEFDLLIFR